MEIFENYELVVDAFSELGAMKCILILIVLWVGFGLSYVASTFYGFRYLTKGDIEGYNMSIGMSGVIASLFFYYTYRSPSETKFFIACIFMYIVIDLLLAFISASLVTYFYKEEANKRIIFIYTSVAAFTALALSDGVNLLLDLFE